MKKCLMSDKTVSTIIDGPSLIHLCQGIYMYVGDGTAMVPGEHVASWEYLGRQYFVHTSILPADGCCVSKSSHDLHPDASVEGAVYSFPTRGLLAKRELNKTESRYILYQDKILPTPTTSTGCIMLSTQPLLNTMYLYYFWLLYQLLWSFQ